MYCLEAVCRKGQNCWSLLFISSGFLTGSLHAQIAERTQTVCEPVGNGLRKMDQLSIPVTYKGFLMGHIHCFEPGLGQ